MVKKYGKCIIKTCANSRTIKTNGNKKNVTYHRFPTCKEKRQEWARVVGLDIDSITDHHRVCSNHFLSKDFKTRTNLSSRVQLSSRAIPFSSPEEKAENKNENNLNENYNENIFPKRSLSPSSTSVESPEKRIKTESNLTIVDTETIEDDLKFRSCKDTATLTSPTIKCDKATSTSPPRKCDRATSVSPERKFYSPTKIRIREFYRNKINEANQKTKRVSRKLQIAERKIAHLDRVITKMKDKQLLPENQLKHLEELGKFNTDLFKREVSKVRNEKIPRMYSPELRSFAITLHYYSPKAYAYVRRKFHTALPHPVTISKWYRVMNGEPGICAEALNCIKEQAKKSEYPLLVSLMFDGMHIMQHSDVEGKGLVNLGTSFPQDPEKKPELAKEALVFLVNCINQSWKISIGYFLINGLTSVDIAGLVNQCLVALHDCNVKVVSLTFDGTPTNIATAKLLRKINDNIENENDENLNKNIPKGKKKEKTKEDYKWWFKHPLTQEKIFVFLDPCHMVKLMRNIFGSEKKFRDGNGKLIDWKYFEYLQALQTLEGLHLANKLRKAHLNYLQKKMKVKLASQLFSKSVADALKTCKNDLHLKQFHDCGPTIELIEKVNDLFDIFNSRNNKGYDFCYASNKVNYKKALNANNKNYIFDKLNEISVYLKNLTFAYGEVVIESSKKTGFIGFLVCIESLKKMYETLCENNNLLKYIPTYKMSQDHLETLFSCIRSHGGHNRNPTARQFQSAFKKLLLQSELRASDTGNCIPLEHISILHVTSRTISSLNVINLSSEIYRLCQTDTTDFFSEVDCETEENPIFLPDILNISEFSRRIIAYIAGFVVKHLQSKLFCEVCLSALTGSNCSDLYSLITLKGQGGLIYPSNDVFLICEKTEKVIRFAMQKSDNQLINPKYSEMYLTAMVLREFIGSDRIFENLIEHTNDQDALENHRVHLIKCIIQKYVKTRIFHIVKSSNNKDSSRQYLTHLMHFRGH